MARNLKDDNLRNERVIQVAKYVLETKASTRKTAAYFTENYFSISNATVNDYLRNRLPKLKPAMAKEIALILKDNTPSTIDDLEVQKRIYQAVNLLLADYTINEIAESLETTPDIIYDDLTSRLPRLEKSDKISKDFDLYVPNVYDKVKEILNTHRLNNLKKDNVHNFYETEEIISNKK